MNIDKARIGIVGLGYVGLPLAVEFGKRFPTVGFDLKPARVDELRQGRDSTLETTPEELACAERLAYTTDPNGIADCNVYIVEGHDPCVPSDEALTECGLAVQKQPDPGRYDAILVAVAHDQFKELGVPAIHRFGHNGAVLYDVKQLFPAGQIDGRL